MRAPANANPQIARTDAGGPVRRPAAAVAPAVPDVVQSIREARDAVLSKNRELTDKLAAAEDRIAELGYERDDAIHARDSALNAATEFARDNEALRARITEASAAQLRGAGERDSEQARREFEEIVTAISEERNGIRHELALRNGEIDSLRAQIAAVGMITQESAQLAAELGEARRRLDKANEAHELDAAKQKKNLAGLAEQLAAAQKAWSAEQSARLAVEKQLAEQRRDFESIIGVLKAEIAAKSAAAPASAPHREPVPVPPRGPEAGADANQFSEEEIHEALTVMFGCVAAAKENPKTREPVAELRVRLGEFAGRTAGGPRRAMHAIATAGTDFATYLERSPAKIAAGLPLLDKAVETLGWLSLRTGAQSLDLAGALVHAVDDDMDNCECISAALEKVSLLTKYTATPEAALDQIVGSPCELIILDVDLPRMDGFEVHARIRRMPGRERTPIIFLSGHMSTAGRMVAIQPDRSIFVPKPYTLGELSLHTLMLIVEARLG